MNPSLAEIDRVSAIHPLGNDGCLLRAPGLQVTDQHDEVGDVLGAPSSRLHRQQVGGGGHGDWSPLSDLMILWRTGRAVIRA